MSSGLPDFDALWNYDKPRDTEQSFRVLLPEARGSADVLYLAELLTQLARTQGLQSRFEAAHKTSRRGRSLLSDSGSRFPLPYSN
jgi:hypothetical protein